MRQITWLALGYNVPANPSRDRVYVWRKLKEFGAGYFKQGVAILPKNGKSAGQFQSLASRIRDMGGDATLVELRFCDASDEVRMISWFERQSEDEYLELLRNCSEAVRRFRGSVPQPPEREEYVKKLGKQYSKVRARDFFKSRSHQNVVQSLDELLGDMAHATDDLKKQLAKVFKDV